ncbi:MAG: 7-carboxy-7-deazaguanine synthase QueE [Chitinophagales bacterium]
MNQTSTFAVTNSLPVMEHFYTIQGEGFYQGKPAYFIRLGGCDVGCVWCDVKESWDASKHPLINIETITKATARFPSEICVITGGEPLMYNLTELTNSLHEQNKRTHIETSGAYPLTGQWDWICLSPKKFKAPLPDILPVANELKVVVYHKSDLQWAETYRSQVNSHCRLFLQPEWSKEKEMLPLIVDYVKQYPQWNISLQIHKYMNIP